MGTPMSFFCQLRQELFRLWCAVICISGNFLRFWTFVPIFVVFYDIYDIHDIYDIYNIYDIHDIYDIYDIRDIYDIYDSVYLLLVSFCRSVPPEFLQSILTLLMWQFP